MSDCNEPCCGKLDNSDEDDYCTECQFRNLFLQPLDKVITPEIKREISFLVEKEYRDMWFN